YLQELLNGHPKRICTKLSVHRLVFYILVNELQSAEYMHSKHITIKEQLSIFLYACVTGLMIRHIREWFQ
ncbi:hypothetical protein BS17DRAFT_698738, partial [Gyrodon lividus]